MTGPEHYKEAEKLLATVAVVRHEIAKRMASGDDPEPVRVAIAREVDTLHGQVDALTAAAHVHATLALAAATALTHDRMMPERDGEQWRSAAATRAPGGTPAGGGQL